jgi:hypothetical protein
MVVKIKMADFGSPIFELFPKTNDNTFCHSSNGFVFRIDQTLIKKIIMVTKIQNGGQKPKWSEMLIFFYLMNDWNGIFQAIYKLFLDI